MVNVYCMVSNKFSSVLFCSVLFCSVLFCSVLFCSVLFMEQFKGILSIDSLEHGHSKLYKENILVTICKIPIGRE